MTSKNLHVLLVEDDPQQRDIIASIMRSENYKVDATASAEEAMLALKADKHKQNIDVVFCDWKLGSLNGIDVLNYARKHHPNIGFAIATAYGTIAHAVEALNAGADDYLAKPFQRQELLLCLDKAGNAKQLRTRNSQLSAQLSQQQQLVDLVGNAPCMQQVYTRIEKVSSTNATVLITGESGTGKELAARALHKLSMRKEKAFIAVNCGAIPDNLVEAELFGARKGAYTGAVKDTLGLLQSAHKGSLFLDEIGELSLGAQTKLLRFLQEGKVTPVGDTQEIEVDVRVIAATHRNLPDMVNTGSFREDLYYRLNIVPIEMPPLRKRKEDIPILIDFFLDKFQQSYGMGLVEIGKETLKALLDFEWPGNVRELSNRIERLVLLGDEDILIDELKTSMAAIRSSEQKFALPEKGIKWDDFERQCLEQSLSRFDGNKTLAAKWLGMSYKTFVYRLNKFNLG
ncbi:sigma-54-dependent transcriptional regulator [Glaciecola petra]|uniref:Sigma-54 dependent transcriptional regulator n=1 Tax=Glaciecola petra TaxID=3075602 RepID=A0ABU2ZVH8_9ALTE|nr:sigma-54 dependent transcriptional regulator [Aestuariibacter sp. P117]MDT0596657.1 sigma-54 dependent transcriptional regulator [Aestuariibacter sp. P117]